MKIPPQLAAAVARHLPQLRDNLLLWLLPTVLLGSLGSLYALFHSRDWVATQGILVREEALGELSASGRFNTNEARKAAQETITQVARNRQVVVGALRRLMTDEQRQQGEQPAERDVRRLTEGITVTAAKGVELGQSDMLYLRVAGRSAEDAVHNNRVVAEQLRVHLNDLRNSRTRSVIAELTEKLKLTEANLSEATARLQEIESSAGSDLGELRTLSQAGSGESNLRTSLSQIKNDLRNAKSMRTTQLEQLEFLQAARANPDTILATPNRLLESQPALRRLKDGLVDAQLRVSELLGKMNATHPRVKAAQTAEAEIRNNLFAELDNAVQGVKADLDVTGALITSHEKQMADVQHRLAELAEMRAGYENLVTDVQDRNAQVKEARRALAQARASLEAAEKTSLFALVDVPNPGDGPVGPGRLSLLIASWMGGICVGLGVYFLLTQTPGSGEAGNGRRWSDRMASAGRMLGRRADDRQTTSRTEDASVRFGRRASDGAAAPPADSEPKRRAEDRDHSPPPTDRRASATAPLVTFDLPSSDQLTPR